MTTQQTTNLETQDVRLSAPFMITGLAESRAAVTKTHYSLKGQEESAHRSPVNLCVQPAFEKVPGKSGVDSLPIALDAALPLPPT